MWKDSKQRNPTSNYYMALVHCRECGEMISETAPTCPKCGAKQNIGGINGMEENLRAGSIGLKILSFLIPLAGLILYIVKRNEDPAAAKSYGLWAILGFAFGIILQLFL